MAPTQLKSTKAVLTSVASCIPDRLYSCSSILHGILRDLTVLVIHRRMIAGLRQRLGAIIPLGGDTVDRGLGQYREATGTDRE